MIAIATVPHTVTLISPLPPSWFPALWRWLNERPDANFDDYGPNTFDLFQVEMAARAREERSWGVLTETSCVGAISYQPLTPRLGLFHGICFTESVCGTGIPAEAVQQVLDELTKDGVEKVCAYFFATNRRVARFFQKLGAVWEGRQYAQTLQHGQPIDLELVAFFLRKAG